MQIPFPLAIPTEACAVHAPAFRSKLTLIVSHSTSTAPAPQLDAMLDRDPSPAPPLAVNRALRSLAISSAKRSLSNGFVKNKTGARFETYSPLRSAADRR